MESKLEELGKLKYSIALEISLKEVKPTYDAIYRELRNTRHNGFRPGKHPKGWLEKRFFSVMQKEAVERLIPGYMENALKEHSLRLATIPKIKRMEFNRNSPLSATLDFEIAPLLPPLDYSKIEIERKKIDEVSDSEVEKELENILKREEVLEPKDGTDLKVELNDGVKVSYEGLIKGNDFPGSKMKDLKFVVGAGEFSEFKDEIIGMVSGEEKNCDIILTEKYADNEGKKANFKIHLKEIFSVKKPKLDENLFKKFGVESHDELKVKIKSSIQERRNDEIQTGYRIELSTKMLDLYNEFDLPEQLVDSENEKIKQDLEKQLSEKKITEGEKENKQKEELESAKKELRKKFILDSISEHENLIFDENEAAKEFVGLAQMTGQTPDKLIQSPFGREIYQRIIIRKKGDLALDRVISRIFGETIDKEPADKS